MLSNTQIAESLSALPYFLFFRGQYFHFILEVLTTEKRAHAGPILPFTTEKLALALALTLPIAHAPHRSRSPALTLAQFLFFRGQCFHFILEVLTMEKRA